VPDASVNRLVAVIDERFDELLRNGMLRLPRAE